jgi:hypothetical protein
MDTRGASELLSFVLVFSLVTATVGYVYVGGISGLSDRRDAERVNNAERAFDVLADSLGDLSHGGAPSRATEIRLADARLSAGDPVVVNVTGNWSDGTEVDSGRNFTIENELDPIVYDGGTDARLVYANGAVLRQQSGGSVMLRSPEAVVRDDRVVLPIVETSVESGAVAGSTTVRIRADRAGTTLVDAERDRGSYDLTIRIETPRADAWKRYLEAKGTTCSIETGPPRNARLFGVERRGSVRDGRQSRYRLRVIHHRVLAFRSNPETRRLPNEGRPVLA